MPTNGCCISVIMLFLDRDPLH